MKQTRTKLSKRKTILARQAALRYIRTALLANRDLVHKVREARTAPTTRRRSA